MEQVPTILEKILAKKKQEIYDKQRKLSLALLESMIIELNDPVRSFYNAMNSKVKAHQAAVIAEIKKASPSRGVICEHFEVTRIAQSYEQNGATCLSVLTDEHFFQGSELYLEEARSETSLPVLRKDFIIDEYQIFESRVMGADCILLIAACLTRDEMLSMTRLAYDLGMDVLIEVHNLEELDKVAGLPVRMIGINNRNLNTFQVSLKTTFDLVNQIPDEIIVITESGILSAEDVELVKGAGVYGFLVGEAFMRHYDPGERLAEMFFG